jgi:hypothetical protein
MGTQDLRVEPPQGLQRLRLLVRHGAWSDACFTFYREHGCDGVQWSWRARNRRSVLPEFARLPGLRGLLLDLRGVDDGALSELRGLREAEIHTYATNPLDLSGWTALEQLSITWREGLSGLGGLHALRSCSLWGYEPADLGFLGPGCGLRSLRVAGRGQSVSLGGIGVATGLADLVVEEAQVSSIEGIGSCPALRSLDIAGPQGRSGKRAQPLDLSPLAGHPGLEYLTVRGQGSVRSLEPLLDLPMLNGVSVVDTVVADGRPGVLAQHPGLTHVDISKHVVAAWGDRPPVDDLAYLEDPEDLPEPPP